MRPGGFGGVSENGAAAMRQGCGTDGKMGVVVVVEWVRNVSDMPVAISPDAACSTGPGRLLSPICTWLREPLGCLQSLRVACPGEAVCGGGSFFRGDRRTRAWQCPGFANCESRRRLTGCLIGCGVRVGFLFS